MKPLINHGAKPSKPELLLPTWTDAVLAPFSGGTVANRVFKDIFIATENEVDTYNHHVRMASNNGVLYIMHTTHIQDEDYDGQYVRYSYSEDDGTTWSAPATLVPPQCTPARTRTKRWCYTGIFVTLNGKLYAIVNVSSLTEPRPSSYGLYVEVDRGTVGQIYTVARSMAAIDGGDQYNDGPETQNIFNLLTQTQNCPNSMQAFYDYTDYGSVFFEPSGLVLTNNHEYLLWRTGTLDNTRKYIHSRKNKFSEWGSVIKSQIPDSPSVTIWKRYGSYVYLMGNDTQPGRQNVYFTKANEADMVFDPVYSVITGMSSSINFPGTNKIGGASYLDFVLHNGRIHCGYSIGKEDIQVVSFDDPV
jgi:hypothetical protein